MENLSQIMTIVLAVFTVISTIGGVITTYLSKGKINGFKLFRELHTLMVKTMQDAEAIYNPQKRATGMDVSGMKKSYVLDKLQMYALSNKKPFDRELWDSEIERQVEFSKNVNSNKKTI